MKSGTLLRQVINKLNKELDFTAMPDQKLLKIKAMQSALYIEHRHLYLHPFALYLLTLLLSLISGNELLKFIEHMFDDIKALETYQDITKRKWLLKTTINDV